MRKACNVNKILDYITKIKRRRGYRQTDSEMARQRLTKTEEGLQTERQTDRWLDRTDKNRGETNVKRKQQQQKHTKQQQINKRIKYLNNLQSKQNVHIK